MGTDRKNSTISVKHQLKQVSTLRLDILIEVAVAQIWKNMEHATTTRYIQGQSIIVSNKPLLALNWTDTSLFLTQNNNK